MSVSACLRIPSMGTRGWGDPGRGGGGGVGAWCQGGLGEGGGAPGLSFWGGNPVGNQGGSLPFSEPISPLRLRVRCRLAPLLRCRLAPLLRRRCPSRYPKLAGSVRIVPVNNKNIY